MKKRLSKKMANKTEIINQLAKKKKISIRLATLAFETFFNEIAKSLKKNKQIHIRGFGSFELRSYKAYTGKNPQNNKNIKVKAKKVPFFKPGDIKNRLS